MPSGQKTTPLRALFELGLLLLVTVPIGCGLKYVAWEIPSGILIIPFSALFVAVPGPRKRYGWWAIWATGGLGMALGFLLNTSEGPRIERFPFSEDWGFPRELAPLTVNGFRADRAWTVPGAEEPKQLKSLLYSAEFGDFRFAVDGQEKILDSRLEITHGDLREAHPQWRDGHFNGRTVEQAVQSLGDLLKPESRPDLNDTKGYEITPGQAWLYSTPETGTLARYEDRDIVIYGTALHLGRETVIRLGDPGTPPTVPFDVYQPIPILASRFTYYLERYQLDNAERLNRRRSEKSSTYESVTYVQLRDSRVAKIWAVFSR